MKKTITRLLSALLALVMLASLCGVAFAGGEPEAASGEAVTAADGPATDETAAPAETEAVTSEEPSEEPGELDREEPVLSVEEIGLDASAVDRPAFAPAPVAVNGVVVAVSAPAGVFPAGAVLSVAEAPSYALDRVDAAVEAERGDDLTVAVSYTFDIKVLDADGNELQPADGAQVRVSFSLNEVADRNLETAVYHVSEDESGALSAEALPIGEAGQTVTAETDGFSYYTVEFTYERRQYVLRGGESVPLSAILDELGLTGEVTDVSVSDQALFSASRETGEWIVTAHQAFTSVEWMRVTIGGIEYEIVVTDVEYSSYGSTYWTSTLCCDASKNITDPVIELTFSEDGTKLLKIESSGYYTNSGSAGLGWYGAGFGIDETGQDYYGAYVFKNRGSGAPTNTTAPVFFDDVYVLWDFRSNNIWNRDGQASITLTPNKGNVVPFNMSFTLTEEDNKKLDPNTVYYVNLFLQGWTGLGSVWGTVASTSFQISASEVFRYSADFDYHGHGGTNFTLPLTAGSTVAGSAVATNEEFERWTDETRYAVNNWDTAVTDPTAEGYVFGGWYTDEACTVAANFTAALNENVTYHAKWTALPASAPTVAGVSGAELTEGYATGSVSVSAEAASGHSITGYQWYSNTTNSSGGGTLIEGATGSSYTIPAGYSVGTYYYYCVVTATRADNGETAASTGPVAVVKVLTDEDAANHAALDEYRGEQKTAADALAEEDDSEASKKLIEDAKKAIDELEYDDSKTPEENKAAVDAILEKLKEDLDAQRKADEDAANHAALDEYRGEQKTAADALAEEDDSEASKKLIADAKKAIDELEYDDSKTPEENKAAVDAILEKLKEDLDAQRKAEEDAANHASLDEYRDDKKTAADALAEEDDSEASKKLIADAKKAIDELEYDDTRTPAENKAAVDAILEKLKEDLDAQRRAEEDTAYHAALDDFRVEKKTAADALAKDDDSEASKKLIEGAKKAIDELAYDDEKTLEENKAAIDAILEKLEEDLDAQRESEEEDHAALDEYRDEQKTAADDLAKEDDSEASKKLIADAKKAIDELAYDDSKTPEENKAAIDAILEKLKEDLDAQRKADEDASKSDAVTYSFTAGGSGTWTKGSTGTLDFTVKRSADDDTTYSRFTGIEVDGAAVDGTNYTAVPGSVELSLKAAYLETLSVGEHTLAVRFDDGAVSTGFTVKAAQGAGSRTDDAKPDDAKTGDAKPDDGKKTAPGGAPRTGDENNIALWALLLGASMLGLGAVLTRKRRTDR